MSYLSIKIKREKIKDVFVCRPYQIFTHHLWNWKFIMVHWTPWKKGILIRTIDGSGYYLGFVNAGQVVKEMQTVLKIGKNFPAIHYHDAA